jgi:hypothetical protein
MTITAAVLETPDNVAGRIMGINQDVPWTEGGGLSEVQSYKWIIVDAICTRLKTMSLFRGWTIRRINALPIEAGVQIPFIGIYEDDEVLDGGSYSMGAVGFKHTINMGFQIVIKNNDPEICLRTLDRCEWYLINQLFRDNTLTNMWQAGLQQIGYLKQRPLTPPVQLAGFSRARRKDNWGTTGTKNETAVGQGIVRLSIVFDSEFFPTEFPDLERIALQTGFPLGGDVDDRAGVQQVAVTYDFKPDSGEWIPNPMPDDTQSPLPFPPM